MLREIHGQNYFYTKKLDDAGVRPEDISGLDYLDKLPFTIKSELAADQDRDGFAANLTYPLERYIRFHQTSGTTGRPLRVLDTAESWDWWGGCWAWGWLAPVSLLKTAYSALFPSVRLSASGLRSWVPGRLAHCWFQVAAVPPSIVCT